MTRWRYVTRMRPQDGMSNPCLPSVVSMNEAVRLYIWMKLDFHVHAGPVLHH